MFLLKHCGYSFVASWVPVSSHQLGNQVGYFHFNISSTLEGFELGPPGRESTSPSTQPLFRARDFKVWVNDSSLWERWECLPHQNRNHSDFPNLLKSINLSKTGALSQVWSNLIPVRGCQELNWKQGTTRGQLNWTKNRTQIIPSWKKCFWN